MNDAVLDGTQPAKDSMCRDRLAKSLSYLASLLGQAVPAFRFSMQELTSTGTPLDMLPLREQVVEMWRLRFAKAVCDELASDQLTPGDFPLLWLSPNDDQVLVVGGRLSSGDLVISSTEQGGQTLPAAEAALGTLLRLQSEPVVAGDKPSTARDCFRHALKKRWRVFFEGILASFVISVLALFSSLYTMQVYDRVIPSRGYSTLIVLTTGVVIAILFEFLMKQARAFIVERASRQIDIELGDVFFTKALDIRMDARPQTVGTFASQIRNFESVRNFMTTGTLFVLADAPFALFFLVLIALLAGPVALVPLVMIPVALLLGWFSSRKISVYSRLHMDESNRKNGLLIEVIDGIESIKAAGAGWKQRDSYVRLVQQMAENDVRMRLLNVRSTNITQLIQQFNYVALITAGAYAITQGNLTMGGLIACSILVGRALGPIAQIPGLISQWYNARVALEALDGIMAMPNDRDETERLVVPASCKGDLLLEGVEFGYAKDNPTLKINRLAFKAGERVAVVGPVGSGKSTLIKLLSGLYRPGKGRLSVDGIDVTLIAEAFIREQIGYLPQDVRLFNGTLRENLTLGLPTPADWRILEAAEKTGLDKVIAAHPKGLELEITEGGRGLSGGQRQLVGLTRMLLAKPKILLMDEPTASMDGQLEAQVMQHLFNEMPPDSIIITVTHKPVVFRHVNRMIVMDNGNVVMDDNREKVLSLRQQGEMKPQKVKTAS